MHIRTTAFTKDRPNMDTRLLAIQTVHHAYAAPQSGTLMECRERADWVRRRVKAAAGLLPEPPRSPLRAKIFDRISADGCTIEKVSFESRPGFLVTGNLYRPLRWRGRRPAILCPHGHWPNGRLHHDELADVIARCMNLAALGFVVFSHDMIGYNDSLQFPHRPRLDTLKRETLYGLSPFGMQLWNSMRAVDFLCSLPDVDPARIGCTGASGGATQTYYLAVVDDRVGVIAPAVMVSGHFQGGCLCEEPPLLHLDGLNTLDVIAAIAPRPVLMLAVTKDWTIQSLEFELPALRQIYAIHGAADSIACFQYNLNHNYGKQFREHAYAWFQRWLANDASAGDRIKEPVRSKPPLKAMRVFPDGKLPKGYEAGETLLQRMLSEQMADFVKPPRSAASLSALQEKYREAWTETFSAVEPESVSIGTPVPLGGGPDFSVNSRIIGRRGTGEQIPALWVVPRGADKRSPAALVLCENGKAELFQKDKPSPLAALLISKGIRILAIDMLETGEASGLAARAALPMTHRLYHAFNRSLVAHRAQEVLTALSAMRSFDGASRPALLGFGKGAVIALIARSLAGPLCATVADLHGCRAGQEKFWLGEMYHPGILKFGGLRGAVALGPSSPLCVTDADKGLVEWAKACARLQRRTQPRGADKLNADALAREFARNR